MAASQQQTVLRVQTNIPEQFSITGTSILSVVDSTSGVTYSGTGTTLNPYTGSFGTSSSYITFKVNQDGVLYYDISLYSVGLAGNYLKTFIKHSDETFGRRIFTSFAADYDSYFNVKSGDEITFKQGGTSTTGGTFNVYFQGNLISNVITPNQYQILDLYNDIPIVINKSYSELQDISKRNSDYSIGLKLPGTKTNNKFFENFYNVDNQSLYFDITKKVQCQVLLDDVTYFTGYMKLDRINVQNSKVEYDVTLYSNVGDLLGKMGNNLLRDLDFRDVDYHFNHIFVRDNVLADWRYETLKTTEKVPSNYFYPVMHNGYNYELSGNTTSVQLTGTTGTSLYTTTKLGSWANNSAAYSAGVQRYRINSPEDGVRDNQLKPALNLWSIINLIFKTYGYKIKSDFFSTPWMKLLYMYGYFSDDNTKLTYKTPQVQTLPVDGVEVIIVESYITENESACSTTYPRQTNTWTIYVVKKDTGIPVYCSEQLNLVFNFVQIPCYGGGIPYQQTITIPPNTTGTTFSYVYSQYVDCGFGCPYQIEFLFENGYDNINSNVNISSNSLSYLPQPSNQIIEMTENSYIDFNLIIDQNIKQIDILSSIAKKFNLLFVPDPEVPNQIIVEPYDYFIGTGNIYDWTNKLSWDKGFTVEPAQNFIESELILSDLDDGDAGNKEFKDSNSRIYGENRVYNPTEFKSQSKKIETTFSPQIIRKWNPNNNPNIESEAVGIPLGINYTEQSQEVDTVVDFIYKGVKTKPKLIYNLGNFSPFIDDPNEIIGLTGATTGYFRITRNDGTSPSGSLVSPVVSHTMPLGLSDENKITNDSICILFNSEQPTTIAGDSVTFFNAYTNQDAYNLFYENRINNIYDKNTRFLSGYFDLNLSDIKNLKPEDLIKINEQYFTWNKIDNYNLTTTDLTKVELIQANNNPRHYPTRYFKYEYCVQTGTTYKFSTQFTGQESFYETFYYYSILYDYFIGALGGTATGYTSAVPYTGTSWLAYSIWEVSESDYNSSGTLYTGDTNANFFILNTEEQPSSDIYNQNNVIFINNRSSLARLNVFTGCTDIENAAASIGVTLVGSTISPFTSGITINVTDTGWIRYDNQAGVTQNVYVGSLGNYVITECANCASLRPAFPFADLASWTLVTCGSSCPP